MLISICIVRGYQAEVSGKLTGFASHIQVLDIRSLSSPEYAPIAVEPAMQEHVSAIPGVTHAQRVSQKIGIFKTPDHFAGVMLKGVGEDYDLDFMKRHIEQGKMPEFSARKSSNQIVISRMMADQLGLEVGDAVYSYYFASTVKQRRFKVAGIYNTHLKQFDKMVAVTDLHTVNKLNGWKDDQCSQVEIKLADLESLPGVMNRLNKQFGGVKDKYGAFYSLVDIYHNPTTANTMSWLELLDMNVLVILIIMVCVAGFTMVSGLLILILERTTTIGLLKALGATNTRIRHVFLWYALLIVARGMLWGNVIGLALVALQKYRQVVTLNPDVYYIDAVPVDFSLPWILGLNVATLVVTMLALVLPSFLVAKIQPARALQFE